MLANARVATRLPAQDLEGARHFYADKLGLDPVDERPDSVVTELKRRGVIFEEVDAPALQTQNSIADIAGNYPGKNASGERGAWFRDSEGNLLGVGQLVR